MNFEFLYWRTEKSSMKCLIAIKILNQFNYASTKSYGVIPFENLQNVKNIGFRMIALVSFDTTHYSVMWLLITFKYKSRAFLKMMHFTLTEFFQFQM